MNIDGVTPRRHQAEALAAARARMQAGNKINAFDHGVGSGKTKLALMMDRMGRDEFGIERTLYFSPRRILVDNAVEAFSGRPEHERINDTDGNVVPLIIPGYSGYATTLQSLHSNPALHIKVMRGCRFHLVLDEAQFAGLYTKVSGYLEELLDMSSMATIMTGTFDRHDGTKIIGVPIGADGEPIITHTYGLRESIIDGHCRYPDIRMLNMDVEWDDGEKFQIDEMDSRIAATLKSDRVWPRFAEMFLHEYSRRRSYDAREKALVLAVDQDHAKRIHDWFDRHYGQTALSISMDDAAADVALRDFVHDGNRIMVAVDKCGIGYNNPRIANLLNLTSRRFPPSLHQYSGRTLRTDPNSAINAKRQTALLMVPDDPGMQTYVAWMRGEAEAARVERELCDECREMPCVCPCDRCGNRPCTCQRTPRDPIFVVGVDSVTFRAADIDGGNVDAAQTEEVLSLADKYGITGAATRLAAFKNAQLTPPQQPEPPQNPVMPRDEKKSAHVRLSTAVWRLMYSLYPTLNRDSAAAKRALRAAQKAACGGTSPKYVSLDVVNRAIDRVNAQHPDVTSAIRWGMS